MSFGRRALLASAILALTIFVGLLSIHVWARTHPDLAYHEITGRYLPPGVEVTAYNWTINDNLFHVGHYWLLSGSEKALRGFAFRAGLEQSTDDARWATPDMAALFGESRKRTVVSGFEGEQPRNDWLWIFDGGTAALYEYN